MDMVEEKRCLLYEGETEAAKKLMGKIVFQQRKKKTIANQ